MMKGMGGPAGECGRVSLQQGFVLHRRAYRESSLLLDLFTPDYGCLRVLAKGVRREGRGSAQGLQPFMPLFFSWAGRGELPVLTASEAGGESFRLRGTALFCGFYMNELLLHFLAPRDPHPEIFQLYRETLSALGGGAAEERLLRCFEVSLLEAIGYGLSLECESVQGRAIDPDGIYDYVIDQGPVETEEPRGGAIRGATLIGLRRRSLDAPDQLREAKRLLRRVIHHYLDGRPLKSRELFQTIGKSREP